MNISNKEWNEINMETIRIGVFETNSSSTHSLTMCSKEEYDKWKKGEMLYNRWSEDFMTFDQVLDYCEIKECDKDKYNTDKDYAKDINNTIYDEGFRDYDKIWNDYELETYCQTYTTKGGEEIVAFGKYGYC